MSRSPMQSAVIQYTILSALNQILSHEIGRNAYDSVWEDPVVKNMTTRMKTVELNATTSINSTSTVNSTLPSALFDNSEAFYTRSLPINIFILVLLSPLLYYWQIYLERFFPTRPRGVGIDYSKEAKENIDTAHLSESQEEEVVKRWIAQGKVRRSSISWWNTFVKWVLYATVGRAIFACLRSVVDGFVRWHSFAKILGQLKSSVLVALFSQCISIGPAGALIGFIVVPATKRLVFQASISTAESVFINAFLRLVIPWLISTTMMQEMMANITEELMTGKPQDGVGRMSGNLIGGPDEL